MDNRNIAIFGCGYWGKNLIRCFDNLNALKYVYDINPERSGEYQQKFPSIKAASIETILNDPDIKGVVIATPVETHYELAKFALEHNKDIFVEKPLTATLSESQYLVEEAERRNRVFLVGHLLEYHPAITRLRDFIKEGNLGVVKEIYSHRLNTGKVRQFENVWWSFAPHDILLILNTVQSNIINLRCFLSDYVGRGVADSTITSMWFENGCFSHIYVSWMHPFKLQSFVVVGTEGAIEFADSRANDKLKFYPNHLEIKDREVTINKSDPLVLEYENREPLLEECQDFLNCIQSRQTPKSSGHDGLRVVDILTKAMEVSEG